MVKKLKSISAKKATPAAGLLDSQLAAAVKDSAQQIWLAGMGAFAKAQSEGGKVFEALVKEGASLQRKTQAVAEEKIGEVTGRMSAMAGTVTARAGQNWDKLEAIFEARTEKALGRLGVPTAKDVEALTARVDALAAAVSKLAKGGGAKGAKAAPVAPVARKGRNPRTGAKAPEASPAADTNGAEKPARKRAAVRRTRKAAGESAAA